MYTGELYIFLIFSHCRHSSRENWRLKETWHLQWNYENYNLSLNSNDNDVLTHWCLACLYTSEHLAICGSGNVLCCWAPSHYQGHYWFIISFTMRNIFELYFVHNLDILFWDTYWKMSHKFGPFYPGTNELIGFPSVWYSNQLHVECMWDHACYQLTVTDNKIEHSCCNFVIKLIYFAWT